MEDELMTRKLSAKRTLRCEVVLIHKYALMYLLFYLAQI